MKKMSVREREDGLFCCVNGYGEDQSALYSSEEAAQACADSWNAGDKRVSKVDSGSYYDEAGILRWDTKRKYSREELAAQREEFSREAQKGQKLCLSDLMCNAGM